MIDYDAYAGCRGENLFYSVHLLVVRDYASLLSIPRLAPAREKRIDHMRMGLDKLGNSV